MYIGVILAVVRQELIEKSRNRTKCHILAIFLLFWQELAYTRIVVGFGQVLPILAGFDWIEPVVVSPPVRRDCCWWWIVKDY